jgi:hypothetical protein
MFLDDTALMSSSITGQSRLRRTVAQEYLSISTATHVSKPAASNPKSRPPIPEYKLIALSI